RGLRCVTSLVAPAAGSGAYGTADAAGLCEALREALKNDAADAEAICEAVTRANMRFVPTKTPEHTDVDFVIRADRKQAKRIEWIENGAEDGLDLGPDDLVFITIGSLVDNTNNGDDYTPAKLNEGPAPAWDMWRRIAAKDPAFARPDVFGAHIPESKWHS